MLFSLFIWYHLPLLSPVSNPRNYYQSVLVILKWKWLGSSCFAVLFQTSSNSKGGNLRVELEAVPCTSLDLPVLMILILPLPSPWTFLVHHSPLRAFKDSKGAAATCRPLAKNDSCFIPSSHQASCFQLSSLVPLIWHMSQIRKVTFRELK